MWKHEIKTCIYINSYYKKLELKLYCIFCVLKLKCLLSCLKFLSPSASSTIYLLELQTNHLLSGSCINIFWTCRLRISIVLRCSVHFYSHIWATRTNETEFLSQRYYYFSHKNSAMVQSCCHCGIPLQRSSQYIGIADVVRTWLLITRDKQNVNFLNHLNNFWMQILGLLNFIILMVHIREVYGGKTFEDLGSEDSYHSSSPSHDSSWSYRRRISNRSKSHNIGT